jgi:hypothetical protein
MNVIAEINGRTIVNKSDNLMVKRGLTGVEGRMRRRVYIIVNPMVQGTK